MFIEARKLIGLPVAAIDSGSKIGVVSKVVVEPQNGNLLGFMVKSGGLFSESKALATIDVFEWDPNGLVTRTIDNLVPPAEIVRLNEILKINFDLLDLKAKTEAGKNLGQVENFLVDSATGTVVKYYLKDLISGKRVLSSDKVIKIDKAIIFSDEVGEIPPDAAGVTA